MLQAASRCSVKLSLVLEISLLETPGHSGEVVRFVNHTRFGSLWRM